MDRENSKKSLRIKSIVAFVVSFAVAFLTKIIFDSSQGRELNSEYLLKVAGVCLALAIVVLAVVVYSHKNEERKKRLQE